MAYFSLLAIIRPSSNITPAAQDVGETVLIIQEDLLSLVEERVLTYFWEVCPD